VLPAIVVLLLVLPFSPYGIALMWVRGSYSKAAKTRVTAIWAALMILLTAGAALTVQNQVAGLVAASLASGGLPAPGVAPTPIVFPSAGAPAVKPTLPTGLAPSPPTISVSPGALPTRSADTPIAPAAAAEAKPTASPQPEPDEASDDDDAPGPEMVKVKDTDGSGANMRDKPGQTGTVMKTIPEGTTLEVIGEDRQMDGKTWKNVKDESGAQGWIAAELLEPA
jgi:hypothetical protein